MGNALRSREPDHSIKVISVSALYLGENDRNANGAHAALRQQMKTNGFAVLKADDNTHDLLTAFERANKEFFALSDEEKLTARERTTDQILLEKGVEFNNMGYVVDRFKEYLKLRNSSVAHKCVEPAFRPFIEHMSKIAVAVYRACAKGQQDQETYDAFLKIAHAQSSVAAIHYWAEEKPKKSAEAAKEAQDQKEDEKQPDAAPAGSEAGAQAGEQGNAGKQEDQARPQEGEEREVMRAHVDTGLVTVVCIPEGCVPGLRLHDRSIPTAPGSEDYGLVPERTFGAGHIVVHTGGKLSLVAPEYEPILHKVQVARGVDRYSYLYYMDVAKNG